MLLCVCVVSVQPSGSGLTGNSRFILLAEAGHLVKACSCSSYTHSALLPSKECVG